VLALFLVVHSLWSLTLTLCRRILAFVRTQLSLVSRLLELIRGSVPLVGGAPAFEGVPLARRALELGVSATYRGTSK
jgi:hypothetical protein